MKLYGIQFFSSACLCNELLWDQSVLCDETVHVICDESLSLKL